MQKMKLCALALILPVPLSGCVSTSVATVDAAALCRDWRHMTQTKDDALTDKTAGQIEANNYSRVHWGCKLGKNEAKKG